MVSLIYYRRFRCIHAYYVGYYMQKSITPGFQRLRLLFLVTKNEKSSFGLTVKPDIGRELLLGWFCAIWVSLKNKYQRYHSIFINKSYFLASGRNFDLLYAAALFCLRHFICSFCSRPLCRVSRIKVGPYRKFYEKLIRSVMYFELTLNLCSYMIPSKGYGHGQITWRRIRTIPQVLNKN